MGVADRAWTAAGRPSHDVRVTCRSTTAELGSDPHPQDFPTIGDRVSLGAGAAVIGRLVVGDDVTIGPNAVVVTNVAAGSVVVSPASRIMGTRAPSLVEGTRTT